MASKKSNEDAFSRMNFLYQASSMCLKVPTEQSKCMAAYYGMLLRSVGKKAQARMDPSMKRTLCKGCHTVLVPGVTAVVRLQKRPAARITWLCKCCSTIKRFNLRKEYKIWVEHDEAVVRNNNSNNNNNTADVRTDRNAAGTSASNVENIKSNKNKQNPSRSGGNTGNKGDLVTISVVPDDKPDCSVGTVKLCDTISSDKINPSDISAKQCNLTNADKLNDSVRYITLKDVDLSDKISPSGSGSKQFDVDPAEGIKLSDIRLHETKPSDNMNMATDGINEYCINPIDKMSNIKLSDTDSCVKVNTSNGNNKLHNFDTLNNFEDNSDVKQSSITLDDKSKESVSDVKLCDVEPSGNINYSVNDARLCKHNETSIVMDVDSSNVNETDADVVMEIDNSNIIEEAHEKLDCN